MSLSFNLLDEPLIRYRCSERRVHHVTLPQLFCAFNDDAVRDFPALQAHQRHPWHAFLVQIAALALHVADRKTPFETAEEWRAALLALTPDDPDGAAFSLVAPDDRPAFLQASCKSDKSKTWKKRLATPDVLDMLITSRNHDLKTGRMTNAQPDDWIFALVSLQTQEGFLGAGNYGVSRMNGGFASRPAFGLVPEGCWGRRWKRDTGLLREARKRIARDNELKEKGGVALVWLKAWDGASSLSFNELDPFYIEICRRVRLQTNGESLTAIGTSSKTVRIAAKERNGITGDAWTPVDSSEAKALSITARGFNYKVASELAFLRKKFEPTIAQDIQKGDGQEGLYILAQAVTRGQGKTEGYHERRIPFANKMIKAFREKKADGIAHSVNERINAIAVVRKILWNALCGLFGNAELNVSDDTKDKANSFARVFELNEDMRFFDDLGQEFEADDPEAEHDRWLFALVGRAEVVLSRAFVAGPRSTERRYLARSAALSRFHSGLRSPKGHQQIANLLRQQAHTRSKASSEASKKV